MILVAITGVFCSGKSFVGKIIAELGHPMFSCDDEIHEILSQKDIKKEIKKYFPRIVIGNNIDKKLLAENIFENQKNREKLEEILYPSLFTRQDEFIERHKGNNFRILFFEVPLLYEKSLQSKYNFVVTTYAPESILIKRANHRGVNKKMFFNILKNQLSSKEKKKRADYVIDTSLSKNSIKEKVMSVIEEILAL